MDSPTTIDVHAHALSPRLVEFTADHQGPPNAHNDHLMQTTYRAPFQSIDVRLETMERQGIDMQVVSRMPNFGYWAERDVAEQIVMAANTLIADIGASQVVLGTDYRFDVGEEHPLDVLGAVEGLSENDRERIKRGNALELLGLPT